MTEQEWLNGNQLSLDIFNKKYRINNENFEQWLDRVSGGDEDVKQLILEKKFLFGGRILAGRGLKDNKVTLSNCFVAGSKVLCKRGLINIEDIIIGDEVLSDDGEFHKVSNTLSRHYQGDLYRITSHELYAPIICTPNHKFLTNWGWKRADRIFPKGVTYTGKGQDMLKTAYFKEESIFSTAGEGTEIDFSKYYVADDKNRLIYLDNNLVQVEVYCNCSNVKRQPVYTWRKTGNPVTYKSILTPDFAYFIGRWLGDGSITCRKGKRNPSILQIVFNATTERDAAERCKEIGEKIFGILASVTETKQNVIAIRFESPIISSWFLGMFGEKCDGKFVPDEFLGNKHILYGLLDADGFISTHGEIKLVLKNNKLLQWVQDTCYLNGINAGAIKDISYRQQNTGELRISVGQANAKLNPYLTKEYHDKRQNKVAKGNSDYIYIPSIEVLEEQECDVYNISVEDTHTYNVNGVIVHNCFVLPSPEDNLESIFDVAKMMARTFSMGGGCGINVSKLRPKGAITHNAARESTGPTSFMELYSYITGLISQQGRRGATMICMDCSHPDIEEFINLKSKQGVCEKANISIMVSDDFMEAVIQDKDWVTEFSSPEVGTITKTFKARNLLKLLAKRNWEWAEPGLLYWDRITNYNMNNNNPEYKLTATNPCGELPLQDGGACLLGSINLSEFVLNPFTTDAKIDYQKLIESVKTAVKALNEVLDENILTLPLEVQRNTASNWRPIGLGTFGMSDMLIKMGIKYGSQESIDLLDYVYHIIARTAVKTSMNLAKKYGSYPMCKNPQLIIDSSFIKKLNLDDKVIEEIKKYGLRNAQLLTCAPTGSIATLLEASTGIEPNFALHYTRKTESLDGKDNYYEVFAKVVDDYFNITVGDHKKSRDYNLLPDYFVESKDISPIDRIKVQGTLQKWIDNSISSTINLPETATVEDIYNIYIEAWKHGLKGVTTYRSNCYRGGILTTDNVKPLDIPNTLAPKRPKELECDCYTVKSQGENFVVCVGLLDKQPYEVFVFRLTNWLKLPQHKGIITKVEKGKYSLNSDFLHIDNLLDTDINVEEKAATLYSSMLLRHGISIKYIIKTAKKVNQNITSFSSAMCRVLSKYVPTEVGGKCPECGSDTIHEGGCEHCSKCEWSRCD